MLNKPIIIESNIIIFILSVFLIIKLFYHNKKKEPIDKYKRLKNIKLTFG